MARFTLNHTGPKLDPSLLLEFQAEFGSDLDSKYQDVLLEWNGGVCNPALRSPLLKYPIHFFAGLHRSYDVGLRRLWREFGTAYLGHSILPFASTTGSQWLCFDSSEKNLLIFSDTNLQPQFDSLDVSFSELLETLDSEPKSDDDIEKLSLLPWSDLREVVINAGQTELIDSNGRSLLFNCIRNKNVNSAIELIRSGASVKDTLSVAVGNNSEEIVLELIKHGADPTEALDYAVGPARSRLRAMLREMVKD